MNKKTLILLALAVPFLTIGAGCAKQDATPNPSLTPNTSPVTVVPTPPSDGTRTLVAAETNETWKLYTNKALGYTVNTPTRGQYAPNWEMKYVDQSDLHMINGCYFNHINPTPSNEAVSDNVMVLDGTKFCHTRSENGGSGSNFVVDNYTTALGKKFIVIEFTKLTVDANVMGCTGKMTEAYSLSETACIPFVASDYQITLDGIVGTFQMNASSSTSSENNVSITEETQNQQLSFLDALKLKDTGSTIRLINQNSLFFQVYVVPGEGYGGASAVLKKEGDKYRVLLFDNGLPSCDIIDKEKIPYDMLSTSGKGQCFTNGGKLLTDARLDSTVNWETYTDTKVGFTFKYPDTASQKNTLGLNFDVTVNDLDTMEDAPLGYDKTNALRDNEALANGDPSTSFGSAMKYSLKKLSVKDALAKELTILSQIEICNVQFRRQAIIYKDNYQIILSWWYGGSNLLSANNPNYFTTDSKNCGSEKIWKDASGFYSDLMGGTTDSISQNWFISFDEIIKTIQFTK